MKVRLRIDLCNGVGQGAVNTHVFTPTPTFTPTHLHPCILAHSHIPHTHSHIPHTPMCSHPHTCTYLRTLPQTPTHTFTPTHASKPDSDLLSGSGSPLLAEIVYQVPHFLITCFGESSTPAWLPGSPSYTAPDLRMDQGQAALCHCVMQVTSELRIVKTQKTQKVFDLPPPNCLKRIQIEDRPQGESDRLTQLYYNVS